MHAGRRAMAATTSPTAVAFLLMQLEQILAHHEASACMHAHGRDEHGRDELEASEEL